MATWIVGDVHGCGEELDELLERIGPSASDRLICCGDLFDKGPDPVRVLDRLVELEAEAVLGNHDVLIRDHGGARLGAPAPTRKRAPYVDACLDALEAAGRLEQAVALCRALPLTRSGPGFVVVHGGLHPVLGLAGTDERLATTVRAFPPGVEGAAPWWRQWRGPETVVFGHDARQGLVEHRVAGRPRCIGLDTGCVYGGQLTAWSPELDRFVQVQARATWHQKGG